VTQIATSSEDGARQTKFTPEKIRQIINLVERGKSREEIAEVVGVTVGTLQVTCSKLGVSLRRPRFNTGVGALQQRQRSSNLSSPPQSSALTETNSLHPAPSRIVRECAAGHQVDTSPEALRKARRETPTAAKFTIEMQYKGRTRRTELPLSQEIVLKLALEAEFRGLRLGELLVEAILGLVDDNLLEQVLDCKSGKVATELVDSRREPDRTSTIPLGVELSSTQTKSCLER
jgi:transposase-like protein